MPHYTTPQGRRVYVDPWTADHPAELRDFLEAYDRTYCWTCDTAPCECCAECHRRPGSCWCCEYCHHIECTCHCSGCGFRETDCRCCSDCESYPCTCRCFDCGRDPCQCDSYCFSCEQYSCTCGRLHSYCYEPPGGWEFHGLGPAYYGLEIEISSRNDRQTLQFAQNTLSTGHGTLGWLKSDGSVCGFELVTPPMSYAWAMEHWPWQLLPALQGYDCEVDPSTNGIHVHVSRKAFKSPAHLFRWMKLLYRNQDHVTRIARRRTGEWAAFSRDHRLAQFSHAKKMRDDFFDESGDETQATRYSAINTTNEHTLEVRVFASALDAAEAQSALQLVAAAVEFTRQTRGRDAFSWEKFREWLAGRADEYRALADIEDAAQRDEQAAAGRAAAAAAQRTARERTRQEPGGWLNADTSAWRESDLDRAAVSSYLDNCGCNMCQRARRVMEREAILCACCLTSPRGLSPMS